MFNIDVNKKIIKYKKKRIFKKFNIFFSEKKLPCLITLQNYKLFFSNLRIINFFISKKINIIKKLQKKEKFKKITETSIKKLFFKKNNFYKNIDNIVYKNNIFIKKYKVTTKKILIFQLPKISYTKKSLGVRMGKGKGSIYSWFLNINSGWRLIYFLNWNINLIKYLFFSLKNLLPGKNTLII